MKTSQGIAALVLAAVTSGFNLFGSSSLTTSSSIDSAAPSISPEASNSLAGKPEFYNKAMLELKRLDDEPLCHRIAAQLLMNTCRGLQGINEENLQYTKSRMQRNHVESFAAALTICDMEDVKMSVPDSCRPLSSAALFQAVRENRDTLVVPAEDVGACLTSLSEQEKPWMTWLSRRDTALLFCRASSIDMDNDQLLQSHKKIVQIMAEFSGGLSQELEEMRANLEAQTRETDSYFEAFVRQMERIRAKTQTSLDTVTADVKDVSSSMTSIKKSGIDLQQFMQGLFKTAVEGNAEMAASQEQALSLSTNNIQSRFQGLNELAEKNQEYASYMMGYMQDLVSRMEVASEHQETMKENTQHMSNVLTNATELFLIHADKIEQASKTISRIHDNLGPVAAVGDFISGFTKSHSSLGDWAIRAATPSAVLWLGSYGLPASLARNVGLGMGGFSLGEGIVRFRHLEWSMEWCIDSFMPSAFANQERKHPRQSTFKETSENTSLKTDEEFGFEDSHFEMSR